jgi:hypothetical protein
MSKHKRIEKDFNHQIKKDIATARANAGVPILCLSFRPHINHLQLYFQHSILLMKSKYALARRNVETKLSFQPNYTNG